MNSASAASHKSGSPNSDAKPIVFVVDDDVSVRESLELLISFAGWQPETCASAEEFLARPRVLVPSRMVLDVSLPDLNGLDLQKLVVDRIDMPIIFITGYGDIPMTVQAMKAHRGKVMQKMNADSIADLVNMAAELRLAPPPRWELPKHFWMHAGHPSATAASAVSSKKVNVSCRYKRTAVSVWLE